MPNRFQITAGFVKTVVRTPLDNKRFKKKWAKEVGGVFNVQKREKYQAVTLDVTTTR